MKMFKKLLAAVGVSAGFLAPAPASAVTLQFFDSSVLLYSASSFGSSVTVSSAEINGWNVNFTVGFSANPAVGMILSGNIFRNNDHTGFVNPGAAVTGDTSTLRIRFGDAFVVVPNQTFTLKDSVAISSVAAGTSTWKIGVETGTPPKNDNLLVGVAALGSTTANFTYTPNSGSWSLTAGVDLSTDSVTQDITSGFNFNNTIKIAVVPEPATLLLLGVALVGVGVSSRKRLV